MALSGVSEVHRWLILAVSRWIFSFISTSAHSRAKNDLIQNHPPRRSPLLARRQYALDPFLLLGTDHTPCRVELDSQTLHVIGIGAQVRNVPVVLSSVEGNDIEQVAKVEFSEDPTSVSQVDLANRDPLKVGSLGVDGSVRETDGVVGVGATSSSERVVRVLRTGFEVVVCGPGVSSVRPTRAKSEAQ